ncbi:segregation and condensation protein A [Synechococcus sp. PCC 7335]|uniref:segregation/condensation protein A n=1 Tax=Synechococcus sp. (strain ATCC 29403 / PCC 7335) TaxID=91464 RepID=UPI00017EB420|nr:segregation/condensation protein A [Synechococcus sp. PCC 7335]EDX84104.1 segregation and condensation protein A [Synechococcus sp. PCC 7335]
MSSSLAQSAIAFLIDLAEKGEIDPWDVQVIEVIDRFLKTLKEKPAAVQPTEQGRSSYESSLNESGQAFLYASMLVLLKADTLVRHELEQAEEDFEEDYFEDSEEYDDTELPKNLERHIHRRPVAPPPAKRQVTLAELIEQLESIAAAMSEPLRARSHRPKPHSKREAVRAISELAHQENLNEIADALNAFLENHWSDVFEDAINWMDFELLLTQWTSFRPDILGGPIKGELTEADYKHEKVGVFWGLLFLTSQSKVELLQENFYQDLKVRQLNEVTLAEAPAYVLPD